MKFLRLLRLFSEFIHDITYHDLMRGMYIRENTPKTFGTRLRNR